MAFSDSAEASHQPEEGRSEAASSPLPSSFLAWAPGSRGEASSDSGLGAGL